MMIKNNNPKIEKIAYKLVQLITAIVIIYSFLTIFRISLHPRLLTAHAHQAYRLFIALALLYNAVNLRKRKYSAWAVTLVLLLILTVSYVWQSFHGHRADLPYLIVSIVALAGLIVSRKLFNVKQSIVSLKQGMLAFILLFVGAVSYGTVGFLYFDEAVFSREFTVSEAVIQTFKEFRPFTTDLATKSRTGDAFIDSLPYVGAFLVIIFVLTLYKSGKFRLVLSKSDRNQALIIWKKYSKDSEDWFKFWPHEYHYFINGESFIAYRVKHGTAIALGDPVGKKQDISDCITKWASYIQLQGWSCAAVHVSLESVNVFERLGFTDLTIGAEAVIDTKTFISDTVKSKHFRNITNRMVKKNYTFEKLPSPQTDIIVKELKIISDDWLVRGEHKERQFGLGYFDEKYIRQSSIAVVKNDEGSITAFANIVPSSNKQIATIDLMRFHQDAESGVMHFLISELIKDQEAEGVMKFNLGFVPLAKESLVAKERVRENLLLTLRLLGNRFFAFSGLEQFKSKFEPEWADRYIVYEKNKLPKTLVALDRLMRVPKL